MKFQFGVLKTFGWTVMVAGLLFAGAVFGVEWAEPDKVAEVESGLRTEAMVTWWGFEAGDSTRFLQAALDSPATKVVVSNQGNPWITQPLWINRDNLELNFESGTVLMAKKGAFLGANDSLIEVRGRENIVLRGYGATLKMHRDDYPQRCFRMGIIFRGVRDSQILGLTIKDCGCDGIYVGRGLPDHEPSENIIIRDVVSDNNRRQGLSIVSVDGMLVENSVFKNTMGKAPMAGIDCETHRPEERMSNVIIRNNMFINNSQLGMHTFPSKQTADSKPISILWENNYVRGSVVGIHIASAGPDTPPGKLVYRNNIIEGSAFAGLLIRRVSADSGLQIEFSGNLFINTAHENYDEEESLWYRERFDGFENAGDWFARHGCPSAPIVLTSQGNNPPVQGNISFDNDIIISDLDKPAVVVGGPWGVDHREMFGPDVEPGEDDFRAWKNVSGTIRVVNPHGARMEVLTPVENFSLEVE